MLTVPLSEKQETALFNRATGVTTPISGAMGSDFITGRGPPCRSVSGYHFRNSATEHK